MRGAILERPAPQPALPGARSSRPAGPVPRKALLPSGWPLLVLFGYIFTWLLGFGEYIFLLVAAPMAVALLRRRRIVVPPGFGLWLLFLAWTLASGIMTGQDTPGTVPGNAKGHLLSWALRTALYLSSTVILLYVVNLTEDEMRTRTMVRGLGLVFLTVVVGGYVGMLFPRLTITTPLALVLPQGVANIQQISNNVHLNVSQIQETLGYISARPSAPFGFTNAWGSNFALLLPFFVAGWLTKSSSRSRRTFGALVLAAAVVPLVYSLNRGTWIAIGVMVLYLSVRQALQGRVRLLAVLGAGLLAVALLLTLSPLHQVISERLSHGRSNSARSQLAGNAFKGALSSPIIGWGTTRDTVGSDRSIAAGASSQCPKCGVPPTGTHGQLYLLVFSTGFVGAALFLSFFGWLFWRYRRDRSAVGLAGTSVVLVVLLFTLYYNLVGPPLSFALIGVGVLARAVRSPSLDRRSDAPTTA